MRYRGRRKIVVERIKSPEPETAVEPQEPDVPETAEPPTPVEPVAEPPKEEQSPVKTPPKKAQKRDISQTKMDALKKANEARLRKRIAMEEREKIQNELREIDEKKKYKEEIEKYIKDMVKQHLTPQQVVAETAAPSPPHREPSPQQRSPQQRREPQPSLEDDYYPSGRAERMYRMIFRR